MKVASELADAEGLRGVGVRAIAAKLQISPGTLYNVIGDIDDIILRVNERSLIGLRDALRNAAATERDPMTNVLAAAKAYVDFVRANPRRWSMLIEYTLATDKELPPWYHKTLDETIGTVDQLLRPLIAGRRDRQRAVTILWAALEGIASLTATGKLSLVSDEDPHVLVKLLISRFLGTYQSEDITEDRREAVSRPRRKPADPSARRGRA
ncbi:MAG: WHG domain-containing protein [Pseudomonadota bacterium]